MDEPDSLLSQALAETTQRWFARFQDAGHVIEPDDELPDLWLGCMGDPRFSHLEDTLVQRTFISWGECQLPEIVASFIDGEAEVFADAAFAELAAALPLDDLRARRARLCAEALCHEEALRAPLPHQDPIFSSSTSRPGLQSVLMEVPRPYADRPEWLAQLRAVGWFDLPVKQPLPLYRLEENKPTLVILHLFSGRRRDEDFQ